MIDDDDSPDHPIIDTPFTWELIEFVFRSSDNTGPYIDLVLKRETVTRRLRFFSPEGFELNCLRQPNCFGMRILDISNRQLEGLKVRVTNFEHIDGAPRFWAAKVIEIV